LCSSSGVGNSSKMYKGALILFSLIKLLVTSRL
jgi:hypothetical protein